MPRSPFLRKTSLLLLTLLLFVPSTGAAAPAKAPAVGDLVAGLWSLLDRLAAPLGCIIDPHGGCAAVRSESGCIIDPHGSCATTVRPTSLNHGDGGCILDPHGGCAASVGPTSLDLGDSGCILDPHGGCAR